MGYKRSKKGKAKPVKKKKTGVSKRVHSRKRSSRKKKTKSKAAVRKRKFRAYSRPKVVRKKTTKGVRYIAQKLVKYFPRKYPNYTAALPKAREVLKQIQESGGRVRLVDIFPLIRKKRAPAAPKRLKPEIDQNLLDERPYFELDDYPGYIALTTNEVWFRSTLTPSGLPDIQGGSEVDYQAYFAPFVNYCNILMRMTKQATGTDTTSDDVPYVKCTDPEWEEAEKKWVSHIISTDTGGDVQDFGFDSENPDLEPDQLYGDYLSPEAEKAPVPGEKPIRPPEKPAEPLKKGPETPFAGREQMEYQLKIAEEATKKARIEESTEAHKTLQQYNKMLLEGIITKEEWKDLYSKIKQKL